MPKTYALCATPSKDCRQLLEEVYQGRQTYEFKAGCTIPFHPHDIWIVSRGVIQLRTVHFDGSETTLGLVYPEMPFGLPLTHLDPYEAIALTDVVLMRLSQTEIDQSPRLAQEILWQLNRRLQQTETLLALSNKRFISDRLQALLLLLKKELGQTTPEGVQIGVRFTHQQLANLVGTSRATVTRLITFLRKEGWLSIDQNRHLVIHDSAVISVVVHSCRVVSSPSQSETGSLYCAETGAT